MTQYYTTVYLKDVVNGGETSMNVTGSEANMLLIAAQSPITAVKINGTRCLIRNSELRLEEVGAWVHVTIHLEICPLEGI